MSCRAGRIALALALLLVAGCSQLGVIVGGPQPSAAPGPAASVLARLPVKGRAATTGYEREQFGQRWRDIDRNGCDKRNDILARDLTGPVFSPGTRDCVVLVRHAARPVHRSTRSASSAARHQ